MNTKDKEQTIRELESIVIDACMTAGRYIRENAFNISELEWKKKDDPVTNLDKNSENMIRKQIGEKFNANFYGEEYGIDNNNSNINIYIDPIDGTKSFARGEFLSSVSIAAEYDGELVVGTVYDFMRDILYYATEKGAFVRSPYSIEKKMPYNNIGLIQTTVSFTNENTPYKKLLQEEFKEKINMRHAIGSIALCMAQLAAGSYDMLIRDPHIKDGITDTCDIAAGYYIMKQSGIIMRDYFEGDYDFKKPYNGMVAYNKRLDKGMIAMINYIQDGKLCVNTN